MNATSAAVEIELTIESWRKTLLDIGADLASSKPSPDRWSIAEVVGHLVDSACNNHQRFVRAQYCEELRFPKYEQDEWVIAGNYQNSDWESLIALWYYYNRQIATLIRSIPESKLSISCTITPYDPCTLGALLTDYVIHLKHHLTKIGERIDPQQAK